MGKGLNYGIAFKNTAQVDVIVSAEMLLQFCLYTANLSNIYIDVFEEIAIDTSINKHVCWYRYLDIFGCFWNGKITIPQAFLQHINNLIHTIKFEVEMENEGKLPFLDILVCELGDWNVVIT